MFRPLLVSALLASAVPACGPAYYVEVDDDPVVAPGPPPEDVAEEPGPPPGPGSTWTPGYWYWTGESYV